MRGQIVTKSQLVKIIKEEVEREIELKEQESLLEQAMAEANAAMQNVVKKQYDMAFRNLHDAITIILQELSDVKSQKSGE